MCCLKLILRYPYVILITVILFGVLCFILLFFFTKLPDFRDPKLGFETRGTEISKRILAYELLLDKTVTDPSKLSIHTSVGTGRNESPPNAFQYNTSLIQSHLEEDEEEYDDDHDGFMLENEMVEEDGYFCDVPRSEYARVVFASSTGKDDLLSANKLKSMCKLEDDVIRQSGIFKRICIRGTKKRNCCRSWSLGNYVALLSNKSSCNDINDMDVQHLLELVNDCRPYFRNYSHISHCWTVENAAYTKQCSIIPKRCKESNTVFNILYYLTDVNFVDKSLSPQLTYVMTFLPVAAGISAKELYYDIERKSLSDGITSIIAINFGIKQDVFDQYLVSETIWFGIGLVCVIVLMWIYTASLFITIVTSVLILLSLEISYFLYAFVFQIEFFPFMNLLIVIILIGIGVDDMFIYYRIWCLGKSNKNSMTLERLVTSTLRHATLSMFVTSLTTAAAFYSSYVSNVTVLRCFAIFAGTAVIVNFVLMVVWMPAVIMVNEKWWLSNCYHFSPESCRTRKSICCYIGNMFYEFLFIIVTYFTNFFISVLPCVIVKLRFLWLIIFGILGLGGMVVVLIYPKLKLPSANEFQLFAHEHLFEVYDLKIKDYFLFEKALKNNTFTMPMTVVWGVEATHTGSNLNPLDKGELIFNEQFDISSPEAQMFLLKFCRHLRGIRYYLSEPGIQLTNCFMENFRLFMTRSCRYIDGTNLMPCCNKTSFPLSKEIFDICIKEYVPFLSKSASQFLMNSNAGIRFASGHKTKPVALMIEFSSNQPFTMNYTQMKEFYNYMNDLVTEKMKDAPDGMKDGWFVSYLSFFDLQQSIAYGTPLAIGLSILIALGVAFITTLNVLITIYSMLTISAAIFVTVAILVLIGWELNVLESVTISVAVGLSIDYSLHYGMAYRLSPDLDRQMRVVDATRNISSSVAMAAVTTFLVGASLMPSTVLAYRQLGIFLMIVISVSWTYATFFFLSLLAFIGPKGSFGQLHWPSVACVKLSYQEKHTDKTVYAMSDSTLSSSSTTNHANSSETQELDHLTNHMPLSNNQHLLESQRQK